MQLFGYDGESELRRQGARDVEVAAKLRPEEGKGTEKSGLQLEVKKPLEGRSVQCTENESDFVVVGRDVVGEEPACLLYTSPSPRDRG